MQAADRHGYDVLQEDFAGLCNSALDPIKLCNQLFSHKIITKEIVSYPDPHRSCGWIISPLREYSRSGDVIHPQLRCGSGYETTKETLDQSSVTSQANEPTTA